MRKAGKKRIAKAMADFEEWKSKLLPRIDALNVPGASAVLMKWLKDIEDSLQSGDLGHCTAGLASTVSMQVRWCERGYYSRVENGTWHVA